MAQPDLCLPVILAAVWRVRCEMDTGEEMKGQVGSDHGGIMGALT